MDTKKITRDHRWEGIPLECVVNFIDSVETLCISLTCRYSRVAVRTVQWGKVPPVEPKNLVKDGWLKIIKWMHYHNPPCPLHFREFRFLTKNKTLRAYFNLALDVIT
jgi:hypothetical protein